MIEYHLTIFVNLLPLGLTRLDSIIEGLGFIIKFFNFELEWGSRRSECFLKAVHIAPIECSNQTIELHGSSLTTPC